MAVSFTCATILLTLAGVARGFVLSSDVTLMPHVPPFPQYAENGRSLVLVGGNLYDNNTEIYGTIVRLAVSNNGVS